MNLLRTLHISLLYRMLSLATIVPLQVDVKAVPVLLDGVDRLNLVFPISGWSLPDRVRGMLRSRLRGRCLGRRRGSRHLGVVGLSSSIGFGATGRGRFGLAKTGFSRTGLKDRNTTDSLVIGL